MTITLRPYQLAWETALRRSYATGHRAPCGVLPTGGGKSVCIAHMVHASLARRKRIILAVHRNELVRQLSIALRNADVPHGFIASGSPRRSHHDVRIASVPTWAKRLRAGEHFGADWIIMDEGHHAVAGTWGTILEHYPDAHRLFVTATPERLDGRGMYEVADDLVIGPSTADLVQLGNLALPVVYWPEDAVNDFSAARRNVHGEFRPEDQAEILDRPDVIGCVVEHYRRLIAPHAALAFCVHVTHAEHVAETFRSNGIPAATLHGKLSRQDRRAVIQAFAEGETRVITSANLVSEGFDLDSIAEDVIGRIPDVYIGGVMLLRRTASLALYLQQCGRALRPAPGKVRAVILDHVGNVAQHGTPLDAREWTLEGRKRRATDALPPIKRCPDCFNVCSAATLVCPQCGHVFSKDTIPREITEGDGELVEYRGPRRVADAAGVEDLAALAAHRKWRPGAVALHIARREGREARLEDYIAEGAARHYKPAWARIQYERSMSARQRSSRM